MDFEKLHREESGRILATLIGLLGDFDLAEEMLQEAYAVALQKWPSDGTPANPRAWLISTARHKAIDRFPLKHEWRSRFAPSAESPLRKSRGRSWFRWQRWRSGSCARREKSARRGFPIECPCRKSCENVWTACYSSSI